MDEQYTERALTFPCDGDWMVGVLSLPAVPASRAVLVVVGGPQYRAGSHRQFTLLARHLAQQGIATLRFDYRGMGDSSGDARTFENVFDDLRAAVDTLVAAVSEVREVVIWGLCDGASAAAMYSPTDQRVAGLVLLNPWVRTQAGEARTMLRHYYLRRLLDPGFWRRVAGGGVRLGSALRDLAGHMRGAAAAEAALHAAQAGPGAHGTLSERMADGLEGFRGPMLVILSGNDLTAQEFTGMAQSSPRWRRLLENPRTSLRELPAANHTFSSTAWRDQVALWTCEWLRAW